jgi:hypothetical protein
MHRESQDAHHHCLSTVSRLAVQERIGKGSERQLFWDGRLNTSRVQRPGNTTHV